MSGTVSGAKKARDKNLLNDPDFYKKIGKLGAEAYNAKPSHLRKPRGFAANPELARIAGAAGGRKSRRGVKSNG